MDTLHKTVDLFHNIQIQILETDNFYFCCLSTAGAKCTTPLPWYVSCENLLAKNAMKVLVAFAAFLILLLNAASIALHIFGIIKRQRKVVFASTVLGVNITDFMYGIYLVGLWCANLYFEGNYVFQESCWRSSILCFILCGVILVFSFASPAMMCFLSHSRLTMVSDPFQAMSQSFGKTLRYILLICSICIAAGVFFVVLLWTQKLEIPTFLCSPFIDPTHSSLIIDIITYFTVVLQLLSVCLMSFSYIHLVKYVIKSKVQTGLKDSKFTKSYLNLAIQLVAVTGSNILCFIPSGSVYIISSQRETFPIDLLVWTSIVVLPINPLVNPIIFCTTELRATLKSVESHRKKLDQL